MSFSKILKRNSSSKKGRSYSESDAAVSKCTSICELILCVCVEYNFVSVERERERGGGGGGGGGGKRASERREENGC